MVKQGFLAWVTGLLFLLLALCAHAQPDPVPEPPLEDPKVTEAKDLFRKGVELFKAGDLERALELFQRSREVFPSVQNTSNAAICLNKLGRYDEALEAYEQVLTEFKNELSDRERADLAPAMESLRERVGSLWVSGNVDGAVVVDGRARGKLPLSIAIRVLPGKRVVHVIKDGYATFEREVTVEETKTTRVDASLEPLANAGMLRIEDSSAGSRVFVDGAPMGISPWEGTLGPGGHIVWTVLGDMGSAPKEVVVVQGQKAVVQLASGPLGGEQLISVKPSSAKLAIDGVEVATGEWRGRLPHGKYRLTASEPGYHARTRTLAVDASARRPLHLVLPVDESHPRWPKGPEGALFVELAVGYALGGTLQSGAEENCTGCPDAPFVHGLNATLRGGYRFAPGISIELWAGYMRLYSSFNRTLAAAAPDPYGDLTYSLDDAIVIHGPFGGFGLGYRLPFGQSFAFSARLMGGAMLESATDELSGNATTGGQSTSVVVRDDEPISRAGAVFGHADAGVAVVVGKVDIGLTLGVEVFFLDGPALDGRRLDVAHDCDHAGPGEVGCIQSGVPLADEDAHGVFVLATPQLRAAYSF